MDQYDPSAEELTAMEAELPEWDRLRVRDYFDAVIAEELGAQQSPASPYTAPDQSSVDKPSAVVLPLFRDVPEPGSSTPDSGEAA